jgi:HTH-type transcriptional regulator, competence development regulator
LKDGFGKRLRKLREEKHPDLSLRKLAKLAGIGPGYLSSIERDDERASEKVILALADALGENRDVMLAMDGRVSPRLQEIICKRPALFAELIEKLDKTPDHALVRIVREVRDGDW